GRDALGVAVRLASVLERLAARDRAQDRNRRAAALERPSRPPEAARRTGRPHARARSRRSTARRAAGARAARGLRRAASPAEEERRPPGSCASERARGALWSPCRGRRVRGLDGRSAAVLPRPLRAAPRPGRVRADPASAPAP